MDGSCSRGGCVDVKLDMAGSRGCIPAGAGPTPCGRNRARRFQVYPCWRRVYATPWRVSEKDAVGSLLTQGLLSRPDPRRVYPWCIPARAGYLRWRGEMGATLGCWDATVVCVSRPELGEHEDRRVVPTRAGWIPVVVGSDGETGQESALICWLVLRGQDGVTLVCSPVQSGVSPAVAGLVAGVEGDVLLCSVDLGVCWANDVVAGIRDRPAGVSLLAQGVRSYLGRLDRGPGCISAQAGPEGSVCGSRWSAAVYPCLRLRQLGRFAGGVTSWVFVEVDVHGVFWRGVAGRRSVLRKWTGAGRFGLVSGA